MSSILPDASDANTGESAEAVRLLRRAEAYGPDVQRVDVIETHMSWVFLTETRVYKLKKPVRLPYLDYSTVDARRRYCELELQLNRRLAASVYLRVVPLARERGQLAICARRDVVDWLVEMRRLSADRMLDEQIRRHAVSESEVRQAAALLASFYQRAVPAGWTGHDYRRRLAATLAATRRALTAT